MQVAELRLARRITTQVVFDRGFGTITFYRGIWEGRTLLHRAVSFHNATPKRIETLIALANNGTPSAPAALDYRRVKLLTSGWAIRHYRDRESL
jgi:hypothetical protein